MKLLIHAGTGTVINADDGVFFLDTDTLNDDERRHIKRGLDDDDDEVLIEVGTDRGRRISGEELELTYRNTMSFSPSSLRHEAVENTSLTLSPEAREWVASEAGNGDLEFVCNIILNDDAIWSSYDVVVSDAIRYVYQQIQKDRSPM